MTDFSIPCMRFKQRPEVISPEYALMVADADDVLKWAAIRRREDDVSGPQRRLNKSKIRGIRQFFNLDERNTIPPAITVTLRIATEQINDQYLKFTVKDGALDTEKPGLVIDGQHRLLGIQGLGYKVAVVALLNVDDMETAFQFLVINRKATPVSPDLIRTLALDYREQELQKRLETARLNLHSNLKFVGIMDVENASPFKGAISLVSDSGDQELRFISPSAIESCVAVVQGQNNVRELQNEDTLCDFLYSIWGAAKTQWSHLWNKDSKLMQKVSMVALTTYMTKALISKYDWGDLEISDPEQVRETSDQLIRSIATEFWTSTWKIKISDSATTRDLIIQGLEESTRNIRSGRVWHEDVSIIDEPAA